MWLSLRGEGSLPGLLFRNKKLEGSMIVIAVKKVRLHEGTGLQVSNERTRARSGPQIYEEQFLLIWSSGEIVELRPVSTAIFHNKRRMSPFEGPPWWPRPLCESLSKDTWIFCSLKYVILGSPQFSAAASAPLHLAVQ